MPARKYVQRWEVIIKLHSGIYKDEVLLKSDSYDSGFISAAKGAVRVARRMDGVVVAMALLSADTAWQPVIAGVDRPN